VPDPNIEYRKSQRSQMAADEIRQSQNTSQQSQTQAPRPSGFAMPAAAAGTDAGGPAADAADREAKRTRTDAADVTSGPSAGAGAGAEETQTYRLEAQTNVTGPFAHARSVMEAEIAAAKQMVIDLRRELQLQSATGTGSEQAAASAAAAAVPATTEAARGTRRSRDDAEAEADDAAAAPSASHETATRVIRTNRTIENAPTAQRAKTFAFNTFIFGLGVGAAAYVPALSFLCSEYRCRVLL
jgi:hypothetical protein